MEPIDRETWCEECGEIGWEGVCPACMAFDANPTEFAVPGPA